MAGKLLAWLEIVSHEGATGQAFIHRSDTVNEKEGHLVAEFVNYFYREIFKGYAEGERSVLNSRLNRFKNGCEVAFRRRYYKNRGQSTDDPPEQATNDSETSE